MINDNEKFVNLMKVYDIKPVTDISIGNVITVRDKKSGALYSLVDLLEAMHNSLLDVKKLERD